MRRIRTYTAEQRENRIAKNRIWKKNNPDKMYGYYRRADLKRYYGKTPEWYDSTFLEQGGVCAICETPPADDKKRRLVVDHDHRTNEVRGLLCIKCNNTLERLESVVNWYDKAMEYLGKYQ